MSQLPGWLPTLVSHIEWGCRNSPLLADLAQESLAIQTGRLICLKLWPFIKLLPVNISSVHERLPGNAEAAKNLLEKLRDTEFYYQGLFINQCKLAGLSEDELAQVTKSTTTTKLCQLLEFYCQDSSYIDGIYAIVTAELAATAFSRAALPHYELFFSQNSQTYSADSVEQGLAWLRHHAKPNTRQALWLMRMLGDLGIVASFENPPAVENIMEAIFNLWECPTRSKFQPTTNSSLGSSYTSSPQLNRERP